MESQPPEPSEAKLAASEASEAKMAETAERDASSVSEPLELPERLAEPAAKRAKVALLQIQSEAFSSQLQCHNHSHIRHNHITAPSLLPQPKHMAIHQIPLTTASLF